MGISTTLPQKAACGPQRQMGMLPKIETKVIRNRKFSKTFRMKARKTEIQNEMQIEKSQEGNGKRNHGNHTTRNLHYNSEK